MDAVKFIEERSRMCDTCFDAEKNSCVNCPANHCACLSMRAITDDNKIVSIVEEWSAAHPRKTRQDVFLEQWPKARIDTDGVLWACPINFVYNHPCFSGSGCPDCRREFWMQEVE